MRVHVDMEWPDRPEETPEPQPEAGAIRSWLVRGTRAITLNPRRRLGRHAETRRLLAEDGRRIADPTGVWNGLVSALQRHAVHSALARLRREDRQVLTLAFLQGRTNSEIAGMLHVSVRTVSRRVSVALARLEGLVREAGIWVSAFTLLALAYLTQRLGANPRLAAMVRAATRPEGISVAAAGVATAVVIALVANHPAVVPTMSAPRSPIGTAHSIYLPLPNLPWAAEVPPSEPALGRPAAPSTVDGGGATKHADDGSGQTTAAVNGCGGNPTDAPPQVPVGPRTDAPPHGSPVTHPGKGGCGPHALADL